MENNLLELVMIVKNSGNHIINTLNSIKSIINYYTILDTGSTDNTIQNIKDTLNNIPGDIYQEPFIDFSTSRNRSLDLSKGNCKYQLILDDTYQINGITNLINLIKNIDKPGFGIKIIKNNDMSNIYYSYRIIRTKDNIRYKYKVHELLQFNDEQKDVYIIKDDNIYINDTVDSTMQLRTKSRIYNDIKFLKEDLELNKDDERIICYLGIMYFILNDYETSIEYFNQCINKGNNKDFNFVSYSYLYSIYKSKNNFDIIPFLHNFKNKFPERAEPLYFLSLELFANKQYNKTIKILNLASKLQIPNSLFPIDINIYTKEIPFLMCETIFLKGEFEKTSIMLKKFHKLYPTNFRVINMLFNMTNSQPKQSLQLEKPVIVFCTKNINKDWSPNNITIESNYCEYTLVNLTKQLAKNYRIFVFGDVIEGIYSGVEYFKFEKLLEFCNNYKIHTYVVLGLSKYLLYLPNIENVLLWCNDSEIEFNDYNLQYHETKLKKILCLSNYQVEKVKNNYNIPESYLDTTFNPIELSFFNRQVDKIPYRFIYTSDIIRGLDNLLKIIPKIKLIFPETTLYIFTNKLPNNLQIIVDNLDYVYYSPKLSQEQISIEYLKSDIWLYPTNFSETFCYTAIKSQISEVLCVTTKKGSLEEIVGNRGIIIDGNPSIESVQDMFVNKLKFVLKNKKLKDNLIKKGKDWANKYTIENLNKSWIKKFL